jgi:hypothetical protein
MRESWNIAAQADHVRKFGVEPAKRLARMAGTRLGATEPKPDPKLTVLVQRRNYFVNGGGSSGNGSPLATALTVIK